jgi:hypothetical protein
VIPAPGKDIWLNVPVEEDFASASPYRLVKWGDQYFARDDRDDTLSYRVTIPPQPEWYDRATSKGTPMSKVGVLQGTYLGIYISNRLYWYTTPSQACKFCTTGLNVGVNEMAEKTVDDVVETALAAKAESGVTFVHFNSGYQHEGKGLDEAAPYVKAVKERVGALVGVQVTPSKDLWKYDWLMDLGADHFSFCYEFHNPDYFAKYLPGKQATIGQRAFFEAMEHCAKRMGPGRNSGEIIAGVEPIEDTLRAIDYIVSIGCFPTVCIFRPVIGAEMEQFPSPAYEDMVTVMRHMYRACMKAGLPIGMTPNIQVSLIVNPEDARFLEPPGPRKSFYEAKLKAYKIAAKPLFWWKMRLRPGPAQMKDYPPPGRS